jgi:hypothetical protein
MFTHQQIEHYKAFGFVLVRGLLDGGEVEALTAEVVGSLTAAFGGLGADTDPDRAGGIRGDYLPLASDRTPVSQALIADDPRLFQGSAELLGRPTVPTLPIATCFTSNASWHRDHGSLGGVKFLTYLEPRRADTGALRVLPGSHTDGFHSVLRSYWSQDPASSGFDSWPVPDVVLETDPGDVIVFDAHLFHSSAGGENRLAWSIEYLPWGEQHEVVRDYVNDIVGHTLDGRDGWPTWDDWATGAAMPASREVAIQRLRLLGVLNATPPRPPTPAPVEPPSAAGP